MDAHELRNLQEPLKQQYRDFPTKKYAVATLENTTHITAKGCLAGHNTWSHQTAHYSHPTEKVTLYKELPSTVQNQSTELISGISCRKPVKVEETKTQTEHEINTPDTKCSYR